jgi:hypothetical protein
MITWRSLRAFATGQELFLAGAVAETGDPGRTNHLNNRHHQCLVQKLA